MIIGRLLAVVTIGGVLLLPAPSRAVTIGTAEMELAGGGASVVTALEVNVVFGGDRTGASGARLFEGLVFAPADVGQTVTITSADDPEFAAAAAVLTNGVNNALFFQVFGHPDGAGVGASSMEGEAFFPGGGGIDFSQFTIESLGIRVDAMTLDTPGENRNGDGNWTDVSVRFTLIVNGVPAPEEDSDGDGILDGADNCPLVANPDQFDADGDGQGDACDPDDDGDGDPDATDCAPLDPFVHTGAAEVCNGADEDCDGLADDGFPDADGDSLADCIDPDDDGDGVTDALDLCPGSPPAEVANANGCTLGQLCPCAGPREGTPWRNHGQYVSCVDKESKRFVSAGLLTTKERAALVKEAENSPCGR